MARCREIEPARKVSLPVRCCFLSLADRTWLAVGLMCDEHESGNRQPGDHEGSVHCRCPPRLEASLRRGRPLNVRKPSRTKYVSG